MAKNTIRRRPDSKQSLVDNGIHNGIISSVTFLIEPDPFNVGKEREVITIGITVDTLTSTVVLNRKVTYIKSWNEKSNMYKMLDDLGRLPESGEEFEFEDLIDMAVTVVVKNVESNGKKYSNVDKLLPRATKETSNHKPRVQSNDSILDDTDEDDDIDLNLDDLDEEDVDEDEDED